MKNLIFLAAVVIVSSTSLSIPLDPGEVGWVIFGKQSDLNGAAELIGLVAPPSTAPVLPSSLKSPTTQDCYIPGVCPNGSWCPTWVKCN